jgi:hypothetical protein
MQVEYPSRVPTLAVPGSGFRVPGSGSRMLARG